MTNKARMEIDSDLALLEMESQVERIAREFCSLLRDGLTARQLALVRSRNKRETNPSICHSHDFCDPNVYMAQAFKSVMGRECLLNEDQIQADCDLMTEAWTMAKPRI